MTEDELKEMERRLYASDDAMVWAKEFCDLFDGCTVSSVPTEGGSGAVDPGLMVGWFANAMETATFIRKMKDR